MDAGLFWPQGRFEVLDDLGPTREAVLGCTDGPG